MEHRVDHGEAGERTEDTPHPDAGADVLADGLCLRHCASDGGAGHAFCCQH